jgi:hypothetical protein
VRNTVRHPLYEESPFPHPPEGPTEFRAKVAMIAQTEIAFALCLTATGSVIGLAQKTQGVLIVMAERACLSHARWVCFEPFAAITNEHYRLYQEV